MRQNTRTSNGFIDRNIKQWTSEEYDFKMKEIDDMQSKIAYLSSKIERASIDTSKTSKIELSDCQSEHGIIGSLSYKEEEPEHASFDDLDFGMRQFKRLKKNKLNEKMILNEEKRIGIIDRTVVNKQSKEETKKREVKVEEHGTTKPRQQMIVNGLNKNIVIGSSDLSDLLFGFFYSDATIAELT